MELAFSVAVPVFPFYLSVVFQLSKVKESICEGLCRLRLENLHEETEFSRDSTDTPMDGHLVSAKTNEFSS